VLGWNFWKGHDFEDEDNLDIPASDLRLGIAVLDWWEVARWHEA
jgi:hypothetical protein